MKLTQAATTFSPILIEVESRKEAEELVMMVDLMLAADKDDKELFRLTRCQKQMLWGISNAFVSGNVTY